jgi:hypothetical protein
VLAVLAVPVGLPWAQVAMVRQRRAVPAVLVDLGV